MKRNPILAAPRRVDRKVLCFLHDPAQPSGRVFDGGGEFVLGRKSVINGNDAAATMIEYEDGKRSRPGADPAVEP